MPRNNDIGLKEFGRRKIEYHLRKISDRIERERYNSLMSRKEVKALQRAQIDELMRNEFGEDYNNPNAVNWKYLGEKLRQLLLEDK